MTQQARPATTSHPVYLPGRERDGSGRRATDQHLRPGPNPEHARQVERAINRLKGLRAVATRYEKRAYYLGTVTLAALIIWLHT
ncbi:hypothetical protein GCM10010095_14170 [Streptomyces anthocyanicus]|nr:hypothetical protein GCM10010095_14170 [Streptomyces anthocyanicus]